MKEKKIKIDHIITMKFSKKYRKPQDKKLFLFDELIENNILPIMKKNKIRSFEVELPKKSKCKNPK